MPPFEGLKGTVRTKAFVDAQKDGQTGASNSRLWNDP